MVFYGVLSVIYNTYILKKNETGEFQRQTAAMQLSYHVQELHGKAINSTCGYQGSNKTIYRRLK